MVLQSRGVIGNNHQVLTLDKNGNLVLSTTLIRLLMFVFSSGLIVVVILKIVPEGSMLRKITKDFILPFVMCVYFYGVGCPMGQ